MAPRRPCSRGGSQCRVASWPNKARKALVSELRSCCSTGVLAVLHSDYHNSWRELHTTVALVGGLVNPHREWLCRARHCAQGVIGCINVHSESSASSRRPPCLTFCLCHRRPWSPRSIDSEGGATDPAAAAISAAAPSGPPDADTVHTAPGSVPAVP